MKFIQIAMSGILLLVMVILVMQLTLEKTQLNRAPDSEGTELLINQMETLLNQMEYMDNDQLCGIEEVQGTELKEIHRMESNNIRLEIEILRRKIDKIERMIEHDPAEGM